MEPAILWFFKTLQQSGIVCFSGSGIFEEPEPNGSLRLQRNKTTPILQQGMGVSYPPSYQ